MNFAKIAPNQVVNLDHIVDAYIDKDGRLILSTPNEDSYVVNPGEYRLETLLKLGHTLENP